MNKQDEVSIGKPESADAPKKAWVQPVAHATPANAASFTGAGSNDGCCCHT